MATYFANIDLSKIVIGATETGNNGNEYKQIAYNGQQLKNVQLGNGVLDLIRCPFGVEAVSAKQTDKFCVKIDASPTLASFFNEIDQRVIASVDDPTMTHRSPLKTNGNYATLKIKIQSDTQISTTEFVDDKKNKISAFKTGTKDDIVAGSMILPIIKFQGGVYFLKDESDTFFGTSIVATQILVVKNAATPAATVGFDLGDVTMQD
jgi:hypothetical protein